MRTIQLLVIATVMTQCNRTEAGTKQQGMFVGPEYARKSSYTNLTKIDNRLKGYLNHCNSSAITEALLKKLGPLRKQQMEIEQTLKQTAAKSRRYYENLQEPICKSSPRRRIGRAPVQNDIVLSQEESHQLFKDIEGSARTKRHVMKNNPNRNTTWPGRVYYSFNTSDYMVQKVFEIGVKIWSVNTCIDFVEDSNAHYKVVVIKEKGCWSEIGRKGGDQYLSLDDTFLTAGAAVHEIGHVLGLLHTMTRYDRDSFIKILMHNINPTDLNEFAKVNSSSYADDYGLSYDFGSIMHYDEFSCSANNQPTVISTDPHYQKTMGSDLIAFTDIFVVNEHHGCNAKCNKSTAAKCANEGFPHPRNCSVCICPGGYGGELCNQRPSGCGKDLEATRDKQLLVKIVGRGKYLKDDFDFCNYLITAPEGKKIEFDVQSISDGYECGGCRIGGVEVKAQKDQKMTGYRLCSKNGSGGAIVSNSNPMPVIIYNRYGSMAITLRYRYIDS